MPIYKTHGTCSRSISFDVNEGIVTACQIQGGCTGNAQGISKLVVGRKANEVVTLLKGIQCQNGTSCPDQLARALEALLNSQQT